MTWDWLVQSTGKYCSIRRMEYPEFQTRIFGRMESAPRLHVSLSTYYLYIIWSMAAILRDSTVVVVAAAVVRTRPRAIPLAMITMRKSTHGFPFVSHMWVAYGAPLGGPSGRRSSAINNSLHLVGKYSRKFVRRHYLFREFKQFSEGVPRRKLRALRSWLITSKDKYPSILSRQMEAIVFIILQIFRNTRSCRKIENI